MRSSFCRLRASFIKLSESENKVCKFMVKSTLRVRRKHSRAHSSAAALGCCQNDMSLIPC